MWSAAQRQKIINGYDIHAGFEGNNRLVGYGNSVHWHGHVLRREDGHISRRALDFEVEGQRKNGRSKRTWKKQVEEESMKVGLRRKDELCGLKWSVGVNKIAAGLR